jgi:hypothetical protein
MHLNRYAFLFEHLPLLLHSRTQKVEDLKARIQTERDVPADRQRIIYKGKVILELSFLLIHKTRYVTFIDS